MSGAAIALAVSAALLHATWNALLRIGADRLWTVTVMTLAMSVIALPVALLLPVPPASAWGYLALSAVLQVGFSLLLVAAYSHGELGQVYPIIRGSIPLLVTLGGLLLAGEQLTAGQSAAVGLIALGVMSLTFGKGRASVGSLLLALACGTVVAGYTTIDALGVRLAADPLAYSAWITLLYAALLTATYSVLRGKLVISLRAAETWKAAAGGVVSLAGYTAVVAAFTFAPAGPVSALRETSVVFAVLIGWLFLGEALTARRVGACITVALGAALLR